MILTSYSLNKLLYHHRDTLLTQTHNFYNFNISLNPLVSTPNYGVSIVPMTPRELLKPFFVIESLKTAKVSNPGKTLPCDINPPISLFTSILSLTLQQLHPRPSMHLSWSSHRCIMLLPPLSRKFKVSLIISLISIFTLFPLQSSQISKITTFRIVLLHPIFSFPRSSKNAK